MLSINRVADDEYARAKYVSAQVEYISPETGEIKTIPSFNISTYRDLSRSKDVKAFDGKTNVDLNKQPGINDYHTFALVNQFFKAQLNDAEHQRLYEYYNTMSQMINSLGEPGKSINLTQLRHAMTDLTTETMLGLNIPHKLCAFIVSINPPLPDLTDIGKRDQDSSDMTFHRPEYLTLTAISTLSKLMAPILGEFMLYLKHPIADPVFKEYFSAELLIPTLENAAEFSQTYFKLQRYMTKTIDAELKKRSADSQRDNYSFILANTGFDMDIFYATVYATILVKKFVNYNVWKDESRNKVPDIMKFIRVETTTMAPTKILNLRKSMPFLQRFDINDNAGGDGTDNVTHLDNVARVSRMTADIPAVVRLGLECEIQRRIKDLNINPKMFQRALNYHLNQGAIRPNDLSQALTSSVFGAALGGAPMMRHQYFDNYTKAVLVTQIYLIQKGFYDLALFITAHSSETPRDNHLPNAMNLINNTPNSREFKECLRRFPLVSERPLTTYAQRINTDKKVTTEQVSIAVQIKTLMDWFLQYEHTYNIAPDIWDLMHNTQPKMFGTEIDVPDTIMRSLCSFFLLEHPSLS